ncbi:MAG TPA: transglycosylase domain-containing protein [Candidatus Saccharimonadales bacterium]
MSQNTGRNRRSRNSYTTKSGKAINLNRSLGDRKKTKKAEQAAEKALYLSTLPKGRLNRLLYRMHPKRMYHYWFSRQGAIMGLKVVGVLILLGFVLTIGMFAYFRKDLPQIKDISGDNLGGSVSYYDSSGTVLLFQDYNGIKRVPVQSNQISPYMKDATIAIEDKNFYKEGAFDVRAIARAASHDVLGGGGSLQGGSTITQQLVKLNENWTDDRTITRKVKELILAVEVEREYSKDQILTGYLNIAPYGGVDYGVQSASEDYFRTSAQNLTLAQASMLAAIPQAPSYYSPYGSTKFNPAAGDTFDAAALIDRQDYILDLMVTQGYITKAQADAAKSVDVLAQVQPETNKYTNIKYPYFVLAAKQQLQTQFGSSLVSRGGLKVVTTLNTQLQDDANQDVAKNARNVANAGGDAEAMAAEDVKTGKIVALVGGEDFNNPNFGEINFGDTNILPGSSVKPFVYSTLVNNNTNVGAGSVLYDVQQPIIAGGTDYYPCTNKALPLANSGGGNCLYDYDFRYPGPETLRYALAGSRNVPAIKAVLSEDPTDTTAGHTASINLFTKTYDALANAPGGMNCYNAGTNTLNPSKSDISQCYASAGIGDGVYTHIDQQVNADSSLARLGQSIPTTYISQVTDAANKVLYQWTQPKPTQAIKPDAAYIIDNILSDPKASYLPTSYKFQNYKGWDIAVKTGTQNNNYDGLMTAWSTQYAVVSWVGNHTGSVSLTSGAMEYITEPLTRTWIEQALDSLHTTPINWAAPKDLKLVNAYVQRTHVGVGSIEPGPTTEIFPSWYVGKNSGTTTQTTDKVSGYLATTCTPTLARQSLGGASDGSFSVDIFYPSAVSNMAALGGGPAASKTVAGQSDNIHNCTNTSPTVTVTATNTGNGNAQTGICNTSCTIAVAATAGTHPLSGGTYTTSPAGTIVVRLNGNVINTVTIPSDQGQNFNDSFTYNPTSSGTGVISATVVDSVLYDGTGNANVTYSAALSGFGITKDSTGLDTFTWTGGVPGYTVSSQGGTPYCTTSNNSCTAMGVPPNTTIILVDSTGVQTRFQSPRKVKKKARNLTLL